MKKVFRLLEDFFNLVFPNTCAACGNSLVRNEEVICTMCLFQLPKTKFHDDKENPVSKMFWGRVKVENATSYYLFLKGSKFRKLIHKLKYTGEKEIGYVLGKCLGSELSKHQEYDNVDIVVPVPLHPKREKQRGYNQSDWIGKGVAESMKLPFNKSSLYRKVANVTQTKKSREDRWDNVSSIFDIKTPDTFRGKHILLIDDVVTTGSTLEACAAVLLKEENTKVSIATLAYAN